MIDYKGLREQMRLTQEELGNEIGVSQEIVCKMENSEPKLLRNTKIRFLNFALERGVITRENYITEIRTLIEG